MIPILNALRATARPDGWKINFPDSSSIHSLPPSVSVLKVF